MVPEPSQPRLSPFTTRRVQAALISQDCTNSQFGSPLLIRELLAIAHHQTQISHFLWSQPNLWYQSGATEFCLHARVAVVGLVGIEFHPRRISRVRQIHAPPSPCNQFVCKVGSTGAGFQRNRLHNSKLLGISHHVLHSIGAASVTQLLAIAATYTHLHQRGVVVQAHVNRYRNHARCSSLWVNRSRNRQPTSLNNGHSSLSLRLRGEGNYNVYSPWHRTSGIWATRA